MVVNMAKKTILVIDDNEMIIKALRALLGEEHIEVYGAENGALGIKEYARIKPDLVITDMEMPVMSGEKVIARIKAEYPLQKVLAMSSRSSNEKGYTDLMVDGAPLPHQPDTIIRWLIDRLRS